MRELLLSLQMYCIILLRGDIWLKDIPFFATPFGSASLILREIPYKKEAYIRVLGSDDLDSLLAECVEFCVMAGARHIYATAENMPDKYPLHNQVLTMRCNRQTLGESNAALWPVQENTAEKFQKLYNDKIQSVDNASYMDASQRQEMVIRGDGYFVHRGELLLGFGRIYDGKLLWVASVCPGAGADVVKALSDAVTDEIIELDVSNTNHKAIVLYERLGFITVGEKNRWYKIR